MEAEKYFSFLCSPARWALVLAGFCILFTGQGAIAQAPPVPSGSGGKEYQAGLGLFEAGKYDEAAAHFSKAAALEPASSLYTQWLGRAYGLQAERASVFSKPKLAVLSREALEKAVTLDPNNIGAHSDLAAYYQAAPSFMGGGLDKARAQVEEIRKRDPYMGKVRAGDLLQDDNHLAEGEQTYLTAAALDARRPEAHERLGFFYQETGKYPQAFSQWDTMLRTDPVQPNALYGLGKTAIASGQRLPEGEEALKKFLQVFKFDPDGPSLARGHFLLGQFAAKRGDRDTARREFSEALRLNPRLKEAEQARSALPR